MCAFQNEFQDYEDFRAATLDEHHFTSQTRHYPGSFGDRLKKFFGLESDTYQPPPPIEGKKTLILDLDETLIHSSDSLPPSSISFFISGDPPFYVYKRPGLDAFLQMCCKKFDTFIFTFADKDYAEPVLDILCPFIDSNHRLYRDLCEAKSGNVRKDLRIFQRSCKDIILVDDSASAVHFNPKNTIKISKWVGSPQDKALIDWLPPLLDECSRADDVRAAITNYEIEQEKRNHPLH
ncbi:hypothetical protein M9Y10_028069 [Tritrichomonas musculus]|uniref:Mitochondrial import inner membrane translocase subunit TIM50 n=1 Tax=Tritrichomonas musculus TaxID=1915356 RepID=A0ABR2KLL3_9EUKA